MLYVSYIGFSNWLQGVSIRDKQRFESTILCCVDGAPTNQAQIVGVGHHQPRTDNGGHHLPATGNLIDVSEKAKVGCDSYICMHVRPPSLSLSLSLPFCVPNVQGSGFMV